MKLAIALLAALRAADGGAPTAPLADILSLQGAADAPGDAVDMLFNDKPNGVAVLLRFIVVRERWDGGGRDDIEMNMMPNNLGMRIPQDAERTPMLMRFGPDVFELPKGVFKKPT